jgi:hypothetical protein
MTFNWQSEAKRGPRADRPTNQHPLPGQADEFAGPSFDGPAITGCKIPFTPLAWLLIYDQTHLSAKSELNARPLRDGFVFA